MIRTLYRRPGASTSPAAAFVEVEATDPLFGAVPSWRFEDDPPGWLKTVADLGDPTAVQVDVVVVDAPATAALQLVPAVDVEVDDDVSESSRLDACPDCSAAGLDPCRPKGDPVAGRPLTRWHRRRRALVEHRDTGSAAGAVVGTAAALILLVVLAVLAFGQAGSGNERGILVPSSRVPSPCPAGTAPGCPDGPRP